jgi:hypothetical protein
LRGNSERRYLAAKRISHWPDDLVPRPTWQQVVEEVERERGERWRQFCERHGDKGRELALYLGRREGRLTLSALANHAGMRSEAAVNLAVKRYERQLKPGTIEAKRAQECRHRLNQMLNV